MCDKNLTSLGGSHSEIVISRHKNALKILCTFTVFSHVMMLICPKVNLIG